MDIDVVFMERFKRAVSYNLQLRFELFYDTLENYLRLCRRIYSSRLNLFLSFSSLLEKHVIVCDEDFDLILLGNILIDKIDFLYDTAILPRC